MSILYLMIAGACELGFIIFFKKSDGFKKKKEGIISVVIMGLGLYLLSLATRTIPIGVAYAIWTGIGASSTVLWGMFFLGENRSWKKFLFVGMIIIGVIGLKLTSH
ncbi:SMR family transporter [Carnobacterium divergens]|uniref:DMT family transporter n=1 Tax=Carnobacterium divergens TaxID=2748 RepID=UPI0028919C81|nr:SMR family transporter [Carnobacterium divergens]MDT1997210.1 SMR family transporter [Carnobacterium divergens]